MSSLGLVPKVDSSQPPANEPGSTFLFGAKGSAKAGPAPHASPEATVQRFPEVDSLTSYPTVSRGVPVGVNFWMRALPHSSTQTSPLPEGELSTVSAAGAESWPIPGPPMPALQTSSEGGFASQTSS